MFFGASASAGALFDFSETDIGENMSNCKKEPDKDDEEIKDGNLSGSEESENMKLFKRALLEATDKIFEPDGSYEAYTPSKRHKRRMNRLFRERVGGSYLPYPEVDNLYEMVRSKLVVKLGLNGLFDRLKWCKRKK